MLNRFKNNVPDPLLQDTELPTFKFKLEKLQGRILAKNFNLPESTFATFPKQEVYFVHGPIPHEPAPLPPVSVRQMVIGSWEWDV